jgi:outer membrane protein assembly factor BamB
MALFYSAGDRTSASAKQESKQEPSSSVMLGINPGRTRAYNCPAVIQPKSVRWKTSKLFVADRSYPLTLTFEGFPGSPPSTTVWTPSGHGFTEPVMIDGTIYFSLYINDGYVFAQETATGGDKWRIKLPDVSLSPVAVTSDAVYVGSSDGTFYALSAATGQELWNKGQKGRDFLTAAPLVANGAVYFSSTEFSGVQNMRPDGRIFALELRTGNQLWVYKTKGTLGAAAFADKTLFVGDSESYLHALDAATGQERWNFKSSGGGVRTPTIMNGVVYFSAYDGSLHAVDAQSGQERWKNTKGPRVATPLALDNGNIYFGGEKINLYAVDIANGQVKWLFKTKKECRSPVLAGGVVCFPTGGIMQALDAATGEEKWKIIDLNNVVSAAILAPGALYFLDGDGHLYALK